VDSLVQRIKDLDQIAFQQLCFHLMSERFPGAKVRYPEGVSGDEGVDLFQGDLTSGPTVWQCKAFQVTVIGDSQKAQIRDSLRDAVKNVSPRAWILCLNMNFDMKAARWFERLQRSYKARGVMVADPFEGLDVARELMFRRTLRDHYFPGLTLEVTELKALIKAASRGLESVDVTTLEKLTTEDAEEWIERLREKDPRFIYEVTFGGERGPTVFPPTKELGLVAAMTDGRKIVKAFARDLEALKLDPVSSHVEFSKGAQEKLLDFIRTGREQHWGPDEIRAFRSTVPLLSDVKFKPGTLSMSICSIPDDQVIPLKLIFRAADVSVSLDYVEFRKVRVGQEEVEIRTLGEPAFGMSLVLPTDISRSSTAMMSTHMPGNSIKNVVKVCSALRLLQMGCDLEIVALKLDAKLCTLRVEPLSLSFNEPFSAFIDDLNAISTKFNSNFILPEATSLSSDDEETFRLLRAFALSEPLNLTNFKSRLIKLPENAKLVPQQFRDEMMFRLEHENATATLFGAEIKLGPTVIQIDRAMVEKLPETLQRFASAKMGSSVPISLRPLTPVNFRLVERESLLSSRSREAEQGHISS
jgi:hypothetical protein